MRRRPKKRNFVPRQNPRHSHADIDPLVNSGNPPHRHQTRAKPYPTRTYRRMVTLAQSSPSCRSASALQSKTATVMLSRDMAALRAFIAASADAEDAEKARIAAQEARTRRIEGRILQGAIAAALVFAATPLF